jgi:hypothetical protein
MTIDEIQYQGRYREIDGDGTIWKVSGLTDSTDPERKIRPDPDAVLVHLTSTDRDFKDKETRGMMARRFLLRYERIRL